MLRLVWYPLISADDALLGVILSERPLGFWNPVGHLRGDGDEFSRHEFMLVAGSTLEVVHPVVPFDAQ